MPVFRYTAIDASNKTLHGTLSAEAAEHVVNILASQGQVPVSIEERSSGDALASILKGRSGWSKPDTLRFLSNLHLLLKSGMDLNRSLSNMVHFESKDKMRAAIRAIQAAAQKGRSLSDALSDANGSVEPFILNAIRAGEVSGKLPLVLERLVEFLERSAKFRSEIIGSLIYPILLAVLSILSLILMVLVVVPQFRPLLETQAANLPSSTRAVLWISAFMEAYALLLFAILIAGIVIFNLSLRDDGRRLAWDRIKLRLPFGVGMFLKKTHASIMTRLLSLLLENGIALKPALILTRDGSRNRAFADSLDEAISRVTDGDRLTAAFADKGILPQLYLDLMRIGEEASNLTFMLGRIADLAETDVETALKRIVAIFSPTLIVVLGGIIAAIVSSVLLAVLSVNDLAF